MYFCMTKSTKSHLRGSLLEISLSFPALPKRAQRLGSVSVQTSCTPATPLYAGVEPAHTRICSILSCDVFARVVSIKPWGETEFCFLPYPPPALACHAVLPATQSRMRKEFKRGKPSSFCPFRTFRTGEKYMVLIVTFRTSEKYLVFHVLFVIRKYDKTQKNYFGLFFSFMRGQTENSVCPRFLSYYLPPLNKIYQNKNAKAKSGGFL